MEKGPNKEKNLKSSNCGPIIAKVGVNGSKTTITSKNTQPIPQIKATTSKGISTASKCSPTISKTGINNSTVTSKIVVPVSKAKVTTSKCGSAISKPVAPQKKIVSKPKAPATKQMKVVADLVLTYSQEEHLKFQQLYNPNIELIKESKSTSEFKIPELESYYEFESRNLVHESNSFKTKYYEKISSFWGACDGGWNEYIIMLCIKGIPINIYKLNFSKEYQEVGVFYEPCLKDSLIVYHKFYYNTYSDDDYTTHNHHFVFIGIDGQNYTFKYEYRQYYNNSQQPIKTLTSYN